MPPANEGFDTVVAGSVGTVASICERERESASKSKLPNHSNQAHTHTLFRPIFKHAQHTHAAPTLPLGDTPNTRALPQTLALKC